MGGVTLVIKRNNKHLILLFYFLSMTHTKPAPSTGKGVFMVKLNQMKSNVKHLLEKHPCLRDDDFLLIGMVYHTYYGIGYENGFLDVMRNHKELGLPSFETIRRTRQKVQEENPQLESSKAKKKERQMAFNEFLDFARGN